MHYMRAESDDGRTIRASGRTKREARENLKSAIEKATGLRHVRRPTDVPGAESALIPAERFAELPDGDYTCICQPVGPDGKLQCDCRPACNCANPGRCKCGHNFSEGRSVKTANRRRFAEGGLSRDEMLQKLGAMGLDMDAMDGCPDEALAEFLRALSDGSGSDETDTDAGLGDGGTSNLSSNFYERGINLSRFSESQKSDFHKVSDYIDRNAAAFRQGGANTHEMKKIFADAIVNRGYTAKDCLGKGF